MRLSAARSLAASLALAAMVLRAFLPDGWMPASAGAPFRICSFDGVHSGGQRPDGPAQERPHAPCAFAAVGHLAPPVLALAAPAEPVEFFRVARFDGDSIAPIVPPYRPNAARAPPAFS